MNVTAAVHSQRSSVRRRKEACARRTWEGTDAEQQKTANVQTCTLHGTGCNAHLAVGEVGQDGHARSRQIKGQADSASLSPTRRILQHDVQARLVGRGSGGSAVRTAGMHTRSEKRVQGKQPSASAAMRCPHLVSCPRHDHRRRLRWSGWPGRRRHFCRWCRSPWRRRRKQSWRSAPAEAVCGPCCTAPLRAQAVAPRPQGPSLLLHVPLLATAGAALLRQRRSIRRCNLLTAVQLA